MKFRFCGGCDVPDWFLSEINMISKLDANKLNKMSQMIIDGFRNPPINTEAILALFTGVELDPSIKLKECIACISYIITTTICYNCDTTMLHKELQQLGLPREHATIIQQTIEENVEFLRNFVVNKDIRVRPLNAFGKFELLDDRILFMLLTIDGNDQRVGLVKNARDELLKSAYDITAVIGKFSKQDHVNDSSDEDSGENTTNEDYYENDGTRKRPYAWDSSTSQDTKVPR